MLIAVVVLDDNVCARYLGTQIVVQSALGRRKRCCQGAARSQIFKRKKLSINIHAKRRSNPAADSEVAA